MKANILINNDGRACLAGFSPPTLTSDQPTTTPSPVQGGTVRWMAPELLSPKEFGLKDAIPTKASDCYALGMLMYEVLGGEIPFAQATREYSIICEVLGGNRPKRPQGRRGAQFTDELWEILELCWKPRSSDRPSVDTVLQRLEGVVRPPGPPSDVVEGMGGGINDRPNITTTDSGMFSLFYSGLIVNSV